jgi:LemA protein
MIGLYIAIGVAVLAGFWAIGGYNGLVRRRMTVRTAWSDIDVQLQRRYDLIPNLVEIAKGYMKHERELLENVTAARSGCVAALAASKGGPTPQLTSADAQLGGLMNKLMIQVEAYPDLKANSNMMQLTEEVTSTENKVSFSRQYYNDAVQQYNTSTETFPSNILAGMFKFQTANFFEVEDRAVAAKAPQIKF